METATKKLKGYRGITTHNPNNHVLHFDNGSLLSSYNTIIAVTVGGKTYLNDRYWDYSTTTGKYRNKYLGETKKETEAKIKSKEYILL